MKNKRRIVVLYLIMIFLIILFHLTMILSWHHIGIRTINGQVIVLTITDYFLFFIVIQSIVMIGIEIFQKQKIKHLKLRMFFIIFEFVLGCIYHRTLLSMIVLIILIPVLCLFNYFYKKESEDNLEYISDLLILKQSKWKRMVIFIGFLFIITHIIFIYYPKKSAYYFAPIGYSGDMIEFWNDTNIVEENDDYFLFRNNFLLGRFLANIGKRYVIEQERTELAEVGIGSRLMGYETRFETITYYISSNYSFKGNMSVGYILKVYAFNIASIIAWIVEIIYIWSHSKIKDN